MSQHVMSSATGAPVAAHCAESSDELLFCFNDTNSFMWAEVDTTIDDPTMRVHVVDAEGEEVGSHQVRLSDLALPR